MSYSRYLNDTEQRVLAEVSRWSRQNGWAYVHGGYNSSDGLHRVVPELFGVLIWSRPNTDARWSAESVNAFTVRQALDELVSRSLLPDRFNSIKWAVLKAYAALDAEAVAR